MEEYNLVITGVGGQGGLTLSRVIAYAAMYEGYSVRVGETLGMSQRGGSVVSFVRFGERIYAPMISEGDADLVIGLEPVETLRNIKYIGEKTIVLMNTYAWKPLSVNIGKAAYPELSKVLELLNKAAKNVLYHDFYSRANELGNVRVMNILMLGAAIGLGVIPLKTENVVEGIKMIVPKKYIDLNLQALEEGQKLASKLTR